MLSTTVIASSSEYLDVTKRSAGEAADESGLTFEEYKKYNGLNPDRPEWMSENEAQMTSLAMNIINISGLSVDEFKKDYGLNIDITDTTTVGELYDSMPLSIFYADKFAEAKEIYGLGDDVDYTDEKALHDAIAEAVKTIAKLYNIEYKAQEFKISYDDVADYAVNSRTMVAYFYGYRTFCTALKELGTSIEAFDEMCLMYAYEDMLLERYNYKQTDDVELNSAIEIFEDAWADITIEDIAMG